MTVITQAGFLPPTGLTADHPIIGWQNVFTAPGQITAQFDNAAAAVANTANPATYLRWISTSGASQFLHLVLPSSSIDYVAIAGHNIADTRMPIGIGSGSGNATVISPAVLAVGDDSTLIFRFNPITTTEIWINLTASGSPPGTIFPQIAVVYTGRLLYVQRRIYAGHVPITQGRTWKATNGMSESGQFLGRIVLQEFLKTKVPLSLLDPTWYRANFDPFLAQAQEEPFFFAWRPSTYPGEVGYGWLTAEPAPVPTAPSNLISVSLEVSGV